MRHMFTNVGYFKTMHFAVRYITSLTIIYSPSGDIAHSAAFYCFAARRQARWYDVVRKVNGPIERDDGNVVLHEQNNKFVGYIRAGHTGIANNRKQKYSLHK